jgi:hypothetical protein
MGSVIIQVEVIKYDKGALVDNIFDHDLTFVKNTYLTNISYYSSSLKNNYKKYFIELGEGIDKYSNDNEIIDYFICKEETLFISIVDIPISFYSKRSDNKSVVDDDYLFLDNHWVDIKEDINELFKHSDKFNINGYIRFFTNLLFKEEWSTDYWGESDVYTEYLGIIEDISLDSLTSESREKYNKRKEEEKKRWEINL